MFIRYELRALGYDFAVFQKNVNKFIFNTEKTS